MNKVFSSSQNQEWETPNKLFQKLNQEFHFTVDVCASDSNTKCFRYWTIEKDGLKQDWSDEICWMNPPYGRVISKWIKKAHDEAKKGSTVICLVPARTDTRWFHDYILGRAEIRFIKGRITFSGKGRAPFPSMIVIYNNSKRLKPLKEQARLKL